MNSLRVFKAAARHLSFTRAAAELGVTQAAISHQIKALERHVGITLFRRLTRQLVLTEEGQILQRAVERSFAGIGDALERISGRDANRPLRVNLRPYFAARWLSPRLNRFWQRHPDIELRLHHPPDPGPDLTRMEADIAVRWGGGEWSRLESELLMNVEVTPVCSPKLARGPPPLDRPENLRFHTLLHEENYDTWIRWLDAAGVAGIDARRGPIIDDSNVRTQAAIDGQGVAMGMTPLLADDFATKRLVRPFDLALADQGYYIVYPPGTLSRPKVRAFRDWLLLEASRTIRPRNRRGS